MKADSIYKLLVYLSVFLYAFIYVDSWLIPVNTTKEKLEYAASEYHRGHRGRYHIDHILKTENSRTIVSESVFDVLTTHDSLCISRSTLTGLKQFIGYEKDGNCFIWSGNFMNGIIGIYVVPVFVLLGIILLVMFDRIRISYLKERFSIFTLAISIGITAFYLF